MSRFSSGRLRSNMTNRFSVAPQANIPRSKFDRSCSYKTTFDAGYLIPIFTDEALPGDTFNLNMTAFGRLATPIVPFMDNMILESFFFAVPYRLVWDNWERFNGAQDNPDDPTDFLCPQVADSDGFLPLSLFDYFGAPVGVGCTMDAFWSRAYNLIWNEWFRHEDLQDSVVVDKDDGIDDPTDYVLLRRGKRYDYFTSCLPFPQKGPAVDLPLGSQAPVKGIGVTDTSPNFVNNVSVRETSEISPSAYTNALGISPTAGNYTYIAQDPDNAGYPLIYADLEDATAATINSLRQAFQVQKMYERDARGGTRYTEICQSHFQVINPDSRLQRPEYLGGGTSFININPIAQTSSTDATTPQGNLAAFGTVNVHNHGFVKSFTEHCIILGLVSVRADLSYQQGMPRMFSRQTRFDFFWPALGHIGEQAVLNKEIYWQNTNADDEVFGYQERYAEYRYKQSLITGQFRSGFTPSLDKWHLAQDFDSLPVLNDEFIVENPPVDRVLAITDNYPQFLFDAYFKLSCARPMSLYGVPGFVDHF